MLILLNLIQHTLESNKILKITLLFHKKRLAAPKLRSPVAPLPAQEKPRGSDKGINPIRAPG